MALYSYNHSAGVTELLPPDKRFPVLTALLKVLVSQVQYLFDIMFTVYRAGVSYPQWSAQAYSSGTRVIYQKSVFESLVNGNITTPSDPSWFLVTQNFIGVQEQAAYSGQKIVLEYALNKWFFTNFQQPPGQSDIYISNVLTPQAAFIIGGTEANSSSIKAQYSSEVIINSYTFSAQPNFIINIPNLVFTGIDAVASNATAIIQAFVNQYIQAGVTYTIQTY